MLNQHRNYYKVDAWLEVTLKDGNNLFIHPGDLELIDKTVKAFRKQYHGELIVVVSTDETLELRRIEGGTVYIPVSMVSYYTIVTPEECERLQRFRAWVNDLTDLEEKE